MDIPETEIYEIGVGILSFIGVIVGILLKGLIDELKHLRKSLERMEQHLSQAKEDLFKVATVVATCRSCPHPDMSGIISSSEKKDE